MIGAGKITLACRLFKARVGIRLCELTHPNDDSNLDMLLTCDDSCQGLEGCRILSAGGETVLYLRLPFSCFSLMNTEYDESGYSTRSVPSRYCDSLCGPNRFEYPR